MAAAAISIHSVPVANLSHVELCSKGSEMRMPMQARYEVSLKTLIAGLGIALLSACSGSPTGPTAPAQPARASIQPVGRSNFTGYVVAENDSTGGRVQTMGQQILRRVPPVDSLASSLQ
ncbi:MAG: hypothetical protein ABIT20_03580 [Gemmatimonadaceae bacterium]